MKGKVAFVVAASVAAIFLLSPTHLQPKLGKIYATDPPGSPGKGDFPWDSITPTKELIWHVCYEKLQCARLEVPLDYSDPEGRKAAIALTRKPALISPKLPFYKGPILFNPGGPGGSGVDLVRSAGQLFSVILGPQFDIVSFDPRGVARSSPRASIFQTEAERVLFSGGKGRMQVANTSDGVSEVWAAAQVVSMLAGDRDEGHLAHITTPNTARDMLSIVEAHGEEQLQYWGFSYGSVLGATFATMFPDKVKRMVIDGVVDSEEYYETGWKTNLLDADKTFDLFFTDCADAGPERCALYSPQPEDIRRNLTRILDKIKHQPIPVKTETSYGLIDYASIRALLFVSLYSPLGLWSYIADVIAKLAAGDPIPLFTILNALRPHFECSCPGRNTEFDPVPEGTIAILCNDGAKISGELSDAEEHFRELSKISEWADMWAGIHMSCTRWPNPSRSFKKPLEANTSHPILLVGNTADPVTPLDSAKKMSTGFKDSVVLTQNSAGHCSLSAPSLCTSRHIAQYFTHGTMPKPGTVCETLTSNFPPKAPRMFDHERQQALLHDLGGDAEADFAVWDAAEKLSALYPVHKPFPFL